MRALQFYLVAIAFLLSLVAAFDLKGQIDLGLKLDNPKVEVPKAPAETRRNVYNSVLRFPDGTGGNRNVMDVLDGATTDDKRRQLAGIARDAYWQMTQSDSYKALKKKAPNALAAMAIDGEIYLSSSLKGGAFLYRPNNNGNPLIPYLLECQLQYRVETTEDKQHRTGAACGEILAGAAFFEKHPDRRTLAGAIFVTVILDKAAQTYEEIRIFPACGDDPERQEEGWGCQRMLINMKAEEVPKELGMTFFKLPDDTEISNVHLQCKPAEPVSEVSSAGQST